MKKRTLTIVMPLVLIGAPLLAGDQPASAPLKAGDRVCVWASTIPTYAVGEVVGIDATALRIRLRERPDAIDVPIAEVTRLQRSLGMHGNIRKAALRGGLVGAGLGVAFTAFAGAADGCEGSCAGWALILGALGGGAGAIVGTGVGALQKTAERWEAIPVGRVGVSVIPEGGGAGLRLSVRF